MKSSRIAAALAAAIVLATTLVATQSAVAATAPTPVVQGNKLVDSVTGATFVPHGVNIPGLEYSCVQGWRTLPAAGEFAAIASWKINTVRLPLNESCWLGLDGAPSGSTVAQYKADVKTWVDGAVAAGLVVILDLHWNAPAGYTASGQRAMPDERSAAFWTSIATTYAGNKSVMFELFNEPYSRSGFTLTWDCWKNGGCLAPVENDATGTLSGSKYTVTGMQALVTAVRATGATQPLLLGGLNYSNDLTGWVANKPTDPLNQLVAAWHNYPGQGCSTTCWNSTITTVAASIPIVTTEFGNTAETTSTAAGNGGNYLVPFMTWADAHGIGYMPWAWWDVGAAEANGNGSDIYALYTGSSFTPKSPSGTKFYNYLASLTAPPAPSAAEAAIAAYYSAQGGASGALGAVVGVVTTSSTNGGGAWQIFANGTVYWTAASGAHSVSGALLTSYTSRQGSLGPLGWPTAEAAQTTTQSVSGSSQSFQNGTLLSSSLGTFAVVSGVRAVYLGAQGLAGSLGWPLADAVPETVNGGGTRQGFQGGSIYQSNLVGTHVVTADLLAGFTAAGGPGGSLGWPASDIFNITANGGGKAQGYQNGSLYYSAATGAFPVANPIRPAYWAASGEGGYLAWPTGSATVSSVNGGGTVQAFQGGSIYASALGGTRVVTAALVPSYLGIGGEAGSLGWPTSGTFSVVANGGGKAQGFQFGSLYYSAAGGYAVSGSIRDFYWTQAGEGGSLGWPTGAQVCAGDGSCSQNFQNGTILWSASLGARIASIPEIEAVYLANSAALGKPSSPVFTITANGGGKAQGYQYGSIYFSPATGAYAVAGTIRAAYWSVAGEGGALGWPTAAAVSSTANGGGTSQSFQNGTIFSSAFGPRIVSGAILTAYTASGAQSGALGWPSSGIYPTTANGGGSAQGFQNASMYSSTAGAFAVSGAIRSYYWSLAGEGGALGWPTAEQTCGLPDGGCSQSFQNGTILWSPTTGARMQSIPEIEALYATLGGPGGVLGLPTSIVYTIAANGGGRSQGFQYGSVYFSPATGAFAVSGPIRAFYWSLAGEGGSLGWPTGAQTCGLPNSGCSQAFQNGTILWTPATGAVRQ